MQQPLAQFLCAGQVRRQQGMVGQRTTPGLRDDRYRWVLDRLKSRRKELGMTQERLGELLGIHRQYVSRVELGERRLDIVEFVDFARALNLDPLLIVEDIEQAST
ncbi:helix-turn-helix domain-containing protein [Erythrobacter vulgaris]|uniref:Helix-turn-helix domain-containing protein n=1 Tax=Qipengyuania vulgaris TaxID=291985 RepID=A0A844XUJ0_9SPHN|nr:helix-turn-helix transcriptional regulator [Qipengyuania vulgaris]MXO48642.1 helix-turn-helix domain-containing protein [Qipengyuania vulgaris]